MADTNWNMGSTWHMPPRTAEDYCSEIANFLRTNPGAWTQDVAARTGDGIPCNPHNPHARSFCMLGLIEHFVDEAMRIPVTTHMMERLPGMFRDMPLHVFNDTHGRTVEEIAKAFERGAERREASPRSRFVEALRQPLSKITFPDWNSIAVDDNKVKKLEEDLDTLNHKLIPWDTIMKQIEREAAA